MQRLSHIGSDHFPVYVVLQTGRIFEEIHEELEQTQADECRIRVLTLPAYWA
ncbi:hypothetical protein IAF36_06585 [Acinetobacter baumannii]|nr:hypothetical protein [Acinetobacter baumannii]